MAEVEDRDIVEVLSSAGVEFIVIGERVPMPRLARRQLPAAVQQALYNLVDLEGGMGYAV